MLLKISIERKSNTVFQTMLKPNVSSVEIEVDLCGKEYSEDNFFFSAIAAFEGSIYSVEIRDNSSWNSRTSSMI